MNTGEVVKKFATRFGLPEVLVSVASWFERPPVQLFPAATLIAVEQARSKMFELFPPTERSIPLIPPETWKKKWISEVVFRAANRWGLKFRNTNPKAGSNVAPSRVTRTGFGEPASTTEKLLKVSPPQENVGDTIGAA